MRHVLAALLLIPLSLVGGTPTLAQAPAPGPGGGSAGAALKALFHDSDEAYLQRNPLAGLYRGDLRYADRLGDFLTNACLAAERAAAESDLRRLAAIDRATLTRKRLRTAYAAIIRDTIRPAEIRVRDFLAKEYLPAAPDSVGLSAMPGGAKLYAYLIESNTTLPLAADAIHALGLSEVASILGEMETQKTAVGFAGTLPELFTSLRMLANSPMSRTDAIAEVERYIAMPGQALAYKIGQLTILRLKAKAQAALGARFDPRAFHAQVLDTGALPMPVLEKKLEDWVSASR
jgi:uncharacterized protein (DUF885 family)